MRSLAFRRGGWHHGGGTDVGMLDQAYLLPALLNPSLRRRPAGERAAT